MKKAIGLFLLVTTALSCISQNDCKELRLINGDTINLYDSLNIQKLKKVFTDLDLANALNEKYEGDISDYIEHIEGLSTENTLLGERITIKDRILVENEIQEEILVKENKKLTKKVNLLKKVRNLFGIGGLTIGSVGTYFIIKFLNP